MEGTVVVEGYNEIKRMVEEKTLGDKLAITGCYIKSSTIIRREFTTERMEGTVVVEGYNEIKRMVEEKTLGDKLAITG